MNVMPDFNDFVVSGMKVFEVNMAFYLSATICATVGIAFSMNQARYLIPIPLKQ